MKDTLSSLDLHHLLQELQVLVGSRLDKVYQGTGERKQDFTFQLHKTGKGKLLLRLLLPGLLYLTEQKAGYDKLPGHFATFLRRHVGNARILKLEQRRFERIVEILVENKNGQFTLLIELIPPGNALLLNEAGKIISLLKPQRHGKRLLRGGALYVPPPEQFDTRNSSEEEVVEKLFTSNKDQIVKAIAIDLGFGGEYAEEVCERTKIAKERSDLKKSDLLKIAKTVKKLFNEKSKPFESDEQVFPIAMKTKKAINTFKTFSQAIESVIVPEESAEEQELIKEQKSSKDKTAEMLKQQKAALAGYKKSAEENQRKGELLYEHYKEIERILAELKEARKSMSWKEIKERVKNKRIVKIDEKKGEVTVEIK